MTDLEKISEWYAKETNKTVSDFDEYDAHVCRVVEGYKKAQKWNDCLHILPQIEERVNVFTNQNSIVISRLVRTGSHIYWQDDGFNKFELNETLKWMPLPKEPKL